MHPSARLATSPRLRSALAFAAVVAGLVFAFSGQGEGSHSGTPPPATRVRSAPRALRPEPVRTAVPTPAPTAPPATPPPTSAPAPAAQEDPSLPGSGPNYYVDDVNGDDGNAGTSEGAAWRTLARASAAALSPGERLLLKRGGVWAEALKIEESGAAGMPVVIAAYGSGPLPVIQGQGSGDCVQLTGSVIVVTQIQTQECWAGVGIQGGASFNRVEGNIITGNVAGVHVSSGASDNVIAGNTISNNNRMSVNTPGGYDDSGAFGVLLNGDRNEVAHNDISGSDASSYDYGRDGAAVEVYGGQANSIHHNVAIDNHAFSELGNARTADNTFGYNLVTSSLPDATFLVTRGGLDGHGPVANTRLFNNTVVLTGPGSQGFVCHAGCNSGVLTMRNNIIQAVWKAGYADGPFDEDYDFYSGATQFSLGPHSAIGDPMFNNPAAGDFRLAAASPAVDSGVDSGYGADLEGRGVPLDGNADGLAVADRGAFERS